MIYYAMLNEKDICYDVMEAAATMDDYYLVQIPSLDRTMIGLWYDRSDNTFKEAPITVLADHSTDEINYKNQNTWLSDVLDGKAESNHTHSQYANSSHTHSEYASSSHSHSNYASSSHTHDYLPLTGGSIEGDLNVNGVVRCNGSQVFYINEENAVIGSANATGLVTLAAGSSATMVANGANFATPNIIPRNNGTNFSIGSSSARFKNIYLQNNPSVSSDIRLKEGVQQLPVDELADFIKGIKLVKYNYIGDDKERIGVIAQQLQEVNPELAKYFVNEEESGFLGLSVADLVFPLIAAVRNLQQRVEELEKGVK